MDTNMLVQQLLENIEGAPLRKELEDTPGRVNRALQELFDGYSTNVESLFKTFEEDDVDDQIVCLCDIEFTSFCEHHMLPFSGYAHVAYLPKDKVIGASKIPRLVLAYAHRLQLQERIAKQVACALMTHLKPYGVCVIVEGSHSCMRCRGVKNRTSTMINSVMKGTFRTDPTQRAEVLALINMRKGIR